MAFGLDSDPESERPSLSQTSELLRTRRRRGGRRNFLCYDVWHLGEISTLIHYECRCFYSSSGERQKSSHTCPYQSLAFPFRSANRCHRPLSFSCLAGEHSNLLSSNLKDRSEFLLILLLAGIRIWPNIYYFSDCSRPVWSGYIVSLCLLANLKDAPWQTMRVNLAPVHAEAGDNERGRILRHGRVGSMP